MVILVYSNAIYGMTGGQFSPTTPEGSITHTSRYGAMEPAFDCCNLAIASGASFVARATSYHVQDLERTLHAAIQHKGTAVVEILDQCPIYFGRLNKYKSASQMMEAIEKDGTVAVAQAKNMTPEQLQGKLLRGILHQVERPEYCEQYEKLCEKAKGSKKD